MCIRDSIRSLFKKLTEIFVIAVNTAAFVNFEFRLFVSFPEFHFPWQINVSDIKQTGIYVAVSYTHLDVYKRQVLS